MALPVYIDVIDDMTGAIGTNKDCICRRKIYKVGGMKIPGSKELYKVCNPRDFKKKPQNHYRKTYVRLANYIETKIRLRGGIDKVE